jgi:hypothetical protein
MLRALALLAMLAGVARSQAITWRFTEIQAFGCPSQVGQPGIDPAQQRYPITSWAGSVTITWRNFDANQPVILVASAGPPVPWWTPCVAVQPDLTLVGITTPWGWARFMWLVPTTAPLSVVPVGITMMGAGQVVELAWTSIAPMASSNVFTIESMR